ncbi:unnamed protein product [Spodoptera exigua]|uniref:Larval cuticle protein 1-like n=1 Tax=Spodoptera exigua TaxID=7107 RepID=A0A835GFH5_SPOEX|nr:hypothetical protein HW555_007271 [Spodoptera exigua]KAH9627621.1 hypothetical protein HF086_010773 [Spodoptera exigua]CAH0699938.1 unnamed protein product [Spodoptera exigua]
MKSMIIVALALVALAAAHPVDDTEATIVRSATNQDPSGAFDFGFETSNGIKVNEQGQLKEVVDEENKPHSVVVVRGTYSYVNSEGNNEVIEYIADENGYRAEGPSVPKVPARR